MTLETLPSSLYVMSVISIILLLAFLVESMVEYLFGAIVENIPSFKPYKWLTMYVAGIVGVIGAFVYGFDIISLLAKFLGLDIQVNVFGQIIMGLAIGRGANYIHDIVKRYFVKPEA